VLLVRSLPLAGLLAAATRQVEGWGAAGWIAFVLLYAGATVLLVPGSVLTLAAGALFGPLLGTALVSAGSTLGASLAFLVARSILRDRIARRAAADRRFASLDRAIGERGGMIVFLVRLSPLFPFNLVNYAFGVTAVGFGPYLLASWGGMLPATFAWVFLGSAGRAALEGGAAGTFRVVAAAATLAVTVLVTRIATRAIREAGVAPPGTPPPGVAAEPPAGEPGI
jgi:uncharacterized membrane protein YdjX (TVP38/TMEM64 family)